MKQILLLLILFLTYLSLCNGDEIHRKRRHHKKRHHHKRRHHDNEFFEEYDDNNEQEQEQQQQSSAHVVISKEGPPPSPQEYTISKLEKAVVCDARGDKTWAKWKEYDLDGVCSRLQYYGEIEGQCETDCDLLCPQGFYEVAKEACTPDNSPQEVSYGSSLGGIGGGYYRQCVGRYKCTQSSYDYWVNLKWWQFLIWEVVIIILGCCFFGLAVGCCIRCYNSNNRRNNRGRGRGRGGGGGGDYNNNNNDNGGGGGGGDYGNDNNNNNDNGYNNNNRGGRRGGDYNDNNNNRGQYRNV